MNDKKKITTALNLIEDSDKQNYFSATQQANPTWFEHLNLGLLSLNENYQIINANTKALELLGTDKISPENSFLFGETWKFYDKTNSLIPSPEKDLFNKTKHKLHQEEIIQIFNTKSQIGNWIKFNYDLSLNSKNEAIIQIFLSDYNENYSIEKTLQKRIELEQIITQLSTKFVNTNVNNIDIEINEALKTVGSFAETDRAYIFLFETAQTMSNTHEWCALGISPEINNLKNLPIEIFPWWIKKINANEHIYLYTLDDLPKIAREEKAILEAQEIKSLLVVPIFIAGNAAGFLGFDSMKTHKKWTQSNIRMLRMLAEIIGNAINHVQLSKKILVQNQELEKLVKKRTAEKESISNLNNAIIETSGVLILTVNHNGQILTLNPKAKQLLGYTSQQAIKKLTFFNFCDEENINLIKSKIKFKQKKSVQNNTNFFIELAKSGVEPIEVNLKNKAQENIPVLLTINQLNNFNQTEKRFSVIATDIRIQKEAEKSKQFQQAAFEKFIYPIIITNIKGVIIWCNKSYESLSQYSKDEIIGKTVGELQNSGEQNSLFYKQMWKTLLNNKTWEGELFNRRKDGTIYPEKIIVTPIVNNKNEITNFIAVKTDLSIQKLDEKYYTLKRNIGLELSIIAEKKKAIQIILFFLKQLEEIEFIHIYISDNKNKTYKLVDSFGSSAEEQIKIQKEISDSLFCDKISKQSSKYYRYPLFNSQKINRTEYKLTETGYVPIRYDTKCLGIIWLGFKNISPLFQKTVDVVEILIRSFNHAYFRIHAQQELLSAKENYELLFKSYSDIILIFNSSWQIINLNKIAQDTLGYFPQELHLQPANFIMSDYSLALAKNAIHQKKQSKIIKLDLKSSINKKIPIEIRFSNGSWNNEDVIFGFANDISERLRAEKQLFESEARWKFALDSSQMGTWDWDIKNNTVFFSKQWKKMLGYEINEIENNFDEWEKRVHKNDLKKTQADLTRYLNGETEKYQNEHRILCKNGTYKWILDVGKIIAWDEKGKPERMIGTHTDISEKKQIINTLQRALNHEKELNNLKTEFVAMASHEFRTPLATMLMAIDTIETYRKKLSDDEMQIVITRIKNNIANLKNIIDQILNLSKIESGKISFNPEKTEINSLIRVVVEKIKQSKLYKHNIILQENEKEIFVSIDLVMMKQVFTNIIVNSLNYSEPSSTVQIVINHSYKMVLVKITDEGKGIPEVDKDVIFEPFKRGSNVNYIRGNGIGLALSKRFVEQNKGTISFQSVVNKGTTFTIEIPICKNNTEESVN